MPWETSHAPRPEELDACVTCGLCLPHCPTFRLTGSESASPRGRLAAMSAVADGAAVVDQRFADVMEFCLQCRACEPVCPSVVPFGRAMEGARAEVAAQLPDSGRRRRAWLLGKGLASRRLMRLATTLAAVGQRLRIDKLPVRMMSRISGLRPLRFRAHSHLGSTTPPVGEQAGRAALLAGCVQDPWFGAVNEAAIELLSVAGYEVTVPGGQTCCGALAAHDGAASAAEELAARNVTAFAGYDLVVSTAAGCSAHLRGYGEWAAEGDAVAERAGDITVVIAAAIEEGRLPRLAATGQKVAVQDPCHLRHAQRVVEEPRSILRAAGLEPVEIDRRGLCCGAAGVYVLAQPETSDQLGALKADQVRATGVTLVASANPGCEMQLRSNLGPGYEVRHPIELYADRLREHRQNL